MKREIGADGETIVIDLKDQVLEIDAPESYALDGDPELAKTPAMYKMVSASVLAQKVKQTDDKLYATVERWAQEGFGEFPAKADFLRDMARAVVDAGGLGEAGATLLAAAKLGAVGVSIPEALQRQIQDIIDTFLSYPERSKPLGFYSSDEQLAAIFRQDRMLMTELTQGSDRDRLQEILQSESRYAEILQLAARLSNPPQPDALDLSAQTPAELKHILCPSRSHETELVRNLFDLSTVPPPNFNLAQELASHVQNGTLNIAPRPDSGWYDHQWFSLEALVAPEKMPEAAQIHCTAKYRGHLFQLFKSILALTRETHCKNLLDAPLCSSPSVGRIERIINIRPDLTIEPLPTYYQRRAASYDFVIAVIDKLFGKHWRDEAIYAEVANTKAILEGASVRSSRELGMEVDGDDIAFAELSIDDPDLHVDARMMVPVFYDVARGQMKVWAFMGWDTQGLTVSFKKTPEVIWPSQNERDTPSPKICFMSENHRVAVPVTAELYVDSVMDREEFRALCDENRTASRILRALGASSAQESYESEKSAEHSFFDPFSAAFPHSSTKQTVPYPVPERIPKSSNSESFITRGVTKPKRWWQLWK